MLRLLIFALVITACETQREPEEPQGDPCAKECLEESLCLYSKGVCVLDEGDPCRQAESCRLVGTCEFSPELGICVAVSNKDCEECEACYYAGSCGANNYQCWPTKPEHCKNSFKCETAGFCKLDDRDCVEGK